MDKPKVIGGICEFCGIDATQCPHNSNEELTSDNETSMSNELKGTANDGAEYTLESPAVIQYKAEFPDVTDEAAIGSIVQLHNNLSKNEDISKENFVAASMTIIELVQENISDEKTEMTEEQAEAAAEDANEYRSEDDPEKQEADVTPEGEQATNTEKGE